jgi:CheY-like chemotaxis protein
VDHSAREISGTILLADDEQNDVFLMRLALQHAGLDCNLVAVPNGEQAMNYLKREMPYADKNQFPDPSLMLLDLKMPRMNGFEVLAWIASQPQAKTFPVVILSSSALDQDRHKAISLGADDYQVKPAGFDLLVELIKEIKTRWWKTIPQLPLPSASDSAQE